MIFGARQWCAEHTSQQTNSREALDTCQRGFKISRYSAARPSRKQIVLVLLLVLDYSIPDYENDEEEDERFARLATIWTDTDRLKIRATSAHL